MNRELIEIQLIKKKISKKDLAKMLDLSYKQLYNILNRENEMKFSTGLKLCRILDINPYDLL